jgi:hypothetical protein
MPDVVVGASNNRLKAIAASKAELNVATVRLDGELAALRATPIHKIAPAAA